LTWGLRPAHDLSDVRTIGTARGGLAAAMQRVTVVPAGQSPRRLDLFVTAQSARLTRAAAQRWIEGGLITVNDRRAKPAQRIRPGDVIACHVAERPALPVEPEPIPIEVLHEDAAILVVNKPPGIVMHPAPGNWTGTLLNALVHHVRRGADVRASAEGGLSERAAPGERVAPADDDQPSEDGDGQRIRPGLVHRLDKGTSGVLVIAKTDAAHRHLSRQFHAHSIHRVYLALVAGAVVRSGLIDQALGRDTRDARRISPRSAAPRLAVTEYHVAERLGPDATLVEVRPHTGRMHQIRVHLASIGHAVLGDATYGAKPTDPALGRPMLHAAVLGFVHPSTGRYAELRAPLPPDMERAVTGRRAATAATSA
jgi:23S rRNA pseudouridine1911/1915/1917 synthase